MLLDDNLDLRLVNNGGIIAYLGRIRARVARAEGAAPACAGPKPLIKSWSAGALIILPSRFLSASKAYRRLESGRHHERAGGCRYQPDDALTYLWRVVYVLLSSVWLLVVLVQVRPNCDRGEGDVCDGPRRAGLVGVARSVDV